MALTPLSFDQLVAIWGKKVAETIASGFTKTDTHDRSGFFIHGDNSKKNESGSEGCVVAELEFREELWGDPDHVLHVKA